MSSRSLLDDNNSVSPEPQAKSSPPEAPPPPEQDESKVQRYRRLVPLLDMGGKRRDWWEDLPRPPTTPDRSIRMSELQRKVARFQGLPVRNIGFVHERNDRADDAEFLTADEWVDCVCFVVPDEDGGTSIVPDEDVRYNCGGRNCLENNCVCRFVPT